MMMGFGAALFVLFLFLLYSCIRHTVLLKMNKFTDINSDGVVEEKAPPPVEVVETEEEELKAKEAAKEKEKMGPSYDMTHTSIPYGTNDAIRRYDWTSPAYMPSMLAPVPRSKELYGQSQPRLILDDVESEDEKSCASDANADEDEILCDELNSDDDSSKVPQTPPSVSSLYRKPATPARSPSRQDDVKPPLDAMPPRDARPPLDARPPTAQSKRSSSAQSRKAATPALVVREEADITEADGSSPDTGRPSSSRSTSSRPRSSRSVQAATPAMEEAGDSSMKPGRPPTAVSVNGGQRPDSAQSGSPINHASSLPPVC